MSLLKRTGEGFLFATLVFLLFMVAFESRINLPPWLHVLGRMHPMFLHFPIVLLLIYLISLWLPSKVNEEWVNALGLLAALTATLTAIMGYILSMEELREGAGFSLHKWGGISMALLAAVFYYMHKSFARTKIIARPLTIVTAILVFLTGHWGGNLTHGDNYLLEPFAYTKEAVAFDQAYVFADVIKPLLADKCGSCHGDGSRKGGLSVLDSSAIMEGGKTGPLYEAGKPDSSLMMLRVLLPLDHKKHMAPRLKVQLTEDEIQLLSAWIKAGAPYNKKVIDLPLSDSFRLLSASYLSPSANGQTAYNFPAAANSTIQSLNNNYRIVVPLGTGSPALTAQFYGRLGYSAKALGELLQVKQQVVELNLAKMPVNDADLGQILQLSNLQKLNLNHTDVTDSGIVQLAGLTKLKELALSGTAVTAFSLQKLLDLPQLTSVFVWNTRLDSSSIAYLQQKNKNVRFQTGYQAASDTTKYTLNPPSFKTPEGIYEDAVTVDIKHGIRGVEIRYTLDGSEPDSLKSAIYKTPLNLDTSAFLRVKAYKEGWHSSAIAQRVFVRKGITIDSIELLAPPDSSFNPQNPRILNDHLVGSVSGAKNKKWYGYKKNDGICLLVFKRPMELKQVQLILLSNVGGNMFPAERIEVWGGMDRKKMVLLSKSNPAMPRDFEPASIVQAKLKVPPSTVRYVKLVIQPVKKIPKWHHNKGKPALALLGEIVVN